jgi:phosphate transport system protein
MVREDFEKHLEELRDEILILGSMVEKSITRSMQALVDRDLKLAQQVVDNDKKINQKRFDIEEKCIKLIATQQPMAGDLRMILSALNIILELERIADHSAGVARIAIMIGDEPPLKPYIDLPRMAEQTKAMLNDSLEAFIERDAEKAKLICKEDDIVDGLYDQVFRELLSFMVEDPKTIGRATRLIWVAHNLERSADRVTNICERVVFMISGKLEDIGASSY